METWDAIRSRRNVRTYADRPIADADLERILEAGRRSPSSQNTQRWDLVVCDDAEQLQGLSANWQGGKHVASSAVTIALIAPLTDDERQKNGIQYDLGQLTMSMMLAAADLGIGSGHAGVRDQDQLRELLGFPEDRFCAWLLAFGYPDDRPLAPLERPNRRPLEDVVHRGRW
jgi:nitroreductase